MKKVLSIIKKDPWLAPYQQAIEGRYKYAQEREKLLTQESKSLSDFATGYMFYGLHKIPNGWIFREWAPNATRIYLIGSFSHWQDDEKFRLQSIGNGNWELFISDEDLKHEDIYKLSMHWDGGHGERIPAWATRVVQDPVTYIFSAQAWAPEKQYNFKVKDFKPAKDSLLIYECHIGMAQEEEKVGSFEEFRLKVLPRIIADGYNAIQIMAIQEHPYYGSFGYHVSNFFAVSSRNGTPEELKRLIDDAHAAGIAVIMDIVHSHAVKNENEGLGRFDGSYNQYFYSDERREHPAWDSLCFDYAKPQVLHFLLSNCKFWLEEYKFDGFRFDGVTSMLYWSHGLNESFAGYEDYYNMNQNGDAICYLTLANELIHQVNPHAITIAEEMSGMPGLALPFKDGGIGFDYRMAMGIPDYWIKLLKEKKDEDWNVTDIFWELTNRRADEKTISYAESHDQALVGDKTIIFRLIDAAMYWHMMCGDDDITVARGMALHKMIRLLTLATSKGAYLNFMGNEFGHPEWIDFPREGNGWSYKYARRQWDLVDRKDLKYRYLNKFDNAMLSTIKSVKNLLLTDIVPVWDNRGDQILAFMRKDLLFIFNFNPVHSFADYKFLTKAGKYKVILNSDDLDMGGFQRIDDSVKYFTQNDPLYEKDQKGWISLYIPSSTALLLNRSK